MNKLITSYASKAVEFDFVKTIKSSESKQSFLLDATGPSSQEFVVPSEVPDKSQWIPDNQVRCVLIIKFLNLSQEFNFNFFFQGFIMYVLLIIKFFNV